MTEIKREDHSKETRADLSKKGNVKGKRVLPHFDHQEVTAKMEKVPHKEKSEEAPVRLESNLCVTAT